MIFSQITGIFNKLVSNFIWRLPITKAGMKRRLRLNDVENIVSHLRAEHSDNELIERVNSVFKRRNLNLESLNPQFWIYLKNVIQADSLPHDSHEIVSTYGIRNLTVDELLSIYSICIRFGLFILGNDIREIAWLNFKKKVESKSSGNDTSGKLPVSIIEDNIPLDRIDTIFSFFQSSSKEKSRQYNDKQFKEYIRGKRVAVVGPKPSSNSDGVAIDSFDIVVRCNYRGQIMLDDNKRHKGGRCDISYFNGEQAVFLFENFDLEPMKNIRWLKFKSKNSEIRFKRLIGKNVPFAGTYKRYDQFLFNGTLNSLPNLLLDLLINDPTLIKVFHFDLQLTARREKNYYPDSWGRNDSELEHFRKTFVNHDPITQYKFLQKLYQNEKIEGDIIFDTLMKSGLNVYIENLNKVFGV